MNFGKIDLFFLNILCNEQKYQNDLNIFITTIY